MLKVQENKKKENKKKNKISLRDRMKTCKNTIDDFPKIDYFGKPRGKEIW